MSDKPTVFLVDDDNSVRNALKWLIESIELQVEVYESASAFLENFDVTRPGCLVLDVRMPGMSGLELQNHLAARDCGLPVLIITGHADVPMCIRAFENGAFAFLEKPLNQQLLLEQIQRAIEEDKKNRERVDSRTQVAERMQLLTPRERDVLELVLEGRSMKQIAAELDVSIPTCSKHRAKVLEKLQVENDVQLVRLITDIEGE